MNKVKYYQIPGEGVVACIDFIEELDPGLYDDKGVEYLIKEFKLDKELSPVLDKLRRYNATT